MVVRRVELFQVLLDLLDVLLEIEGNDLKVGMELLVLLDLLRKVVTKADVPKLQISVNRHGPRILVFVVLLPHIVFGDHHTLLLLDV